LARQRQTTQNYSWRDSGSAPSYYARNRFYLLAHTNSFGPQQAHPIFHFGGRHAHIFFCYWRATAAHHFI
jgi:hypothetical protein